MSRHYTTYLTPSSPPTSNPTSPTTSTELLISGPHHAAMQEPKEGESSRGSKISSSSSTISRTRQAPQTGTEEHDEIVIDQPSTTYSPPRGPPSAHVHPSRPSEDHTPSLSPSALEAGYAKEPDSRHISRTITDDEKRNHGDRTNVWPPWKRDDGWTGWRSEWVKKEALVVPLVVQAFSAGVLDATTYADFMTFASNRKSFSNPISRS